MNRPTRIGVGVLTPLAMASVLWAGVALAATYDSTGTLNHGNYCIGYGWSNSQYSGAPYAGTTQTGGGGPCYRKQNAYFYYNNGSVFDPPSTDFQTYNLFQGAGPGGTCDIARASHVLSWTAGDLGAAHGETEATDC
jgi:hypothetical protein